MTRISKQRKDRSISPRRKRSISTKKTGPKRDTLEFGYKQHENAFSGTATPNRFIPKIG